MHIKSMLTACLLAFTASVHADVVQGSDYVPLKKPIPQLQQNKIEVLEFFSYTCIHCKSLDPVLLSHAQKFPADVYLRKEHVVWDANMFNFARITAAINASNTAHQANPVIFDTLFNDDPRITREERGQTVAQLASADTFKTWAAKQSAWGSAVVKAFDDPSNLAQAKAMEKATYEYGIDSTPQIIVGGKYKLNLSGDFAADMTKLDALINKVRKERGLGAAKTRKTVSTGAALATQANH